MDNQPKVAEELKFTAAKIEDEIMRKEIQSLQEAKLKIECTMVSAYILLLAYLLTSIESKPIFFLLPIPLILVLYKIRHDLCTTIWSDMAYCYVFFSEKGFVWEKRLIEYRKIKGSFFKNFTLLPITIDELLYCSLCELCLIIYILENYSLHKEFTFGSILGILGCILIIITFWCRRLLGILPYKEVAMQRITEWMAVKEAEKNASPSSIADIFRTYFYFSGTHQGHK